MRAVAALVAALVAAPADTRAFCGFYVGGAGAKLFNNATIVVMMRDGTRTVLAMQNNYQGPPADFAMVVPVPVVLQEENVKTLPREIFEKVDQLAAPRLVEYWEMDPCSPAPPTVVAFASRPEEGAASPSAAGGGYGVKVEAQFTVGEYEIVILSAEDSSGLDRWIRDHGYKIPEGAEPILRPYVAAGMKFFVAKVDVEKVKMEGGQAMLSPLRFHYDSAEFSLPVRLGLLNSSGTQDLIVHILARGQRYEVANYPNVTIPTNIDVHEDAKERFGAFYAALFDATLERNKGAVVTEYAWDASTCDPCPGPTLDERDVLTLDGDAIPGGVRAFELVLTRLHARYGRETLGEDLVFRAAPPIAGGREHLEDDGKLEKGARPHGMNNFQARYAIRHPWTGPITCPDPVRGRWGGPPDRAWDEPPATPALKLAFAPRGEVRLGAVVAEKVPELGVVPERAGFVPVGRARGEGGLGLVLPLLFGMAAALAAAWVVSRRG